MALYGVIAKESGKIDLRPFGAADDPDSHRFCFRDHDHLIYRQLVLRAAVFLGGFNDEYLETIAVYQKIAEKMPEYDTVLFHGSCISVDGAGYVFTAASGTGKSTHARLWRELLGDRTVMVNDDKPLLHVNEDGTVIAFGTPWDGKHHLSSNLAVPLKAVCMLERAKENHIREMPKAEALPRLILQAYRPLYPDALAKTLSLIDRMNVKCFRMGCNMELSAAELAYQTMKG